MLALSQRGLAYLYQGDDYQALADFDAALKLDPRHYVALCARGELSIRRQAYQQAVDDYTLAIAQHPELATAYFHRGAALSELGEFERAIPDLDRASRLDPSNAAPVMLRSLIYSTSHDPKFRDGRRALELASQAGERNGWKSGLAWAALAATHAELGQFQLAVKEQAKAVELSPRFEEFREQLRAYQQKQSWRHQPHTKSSSS